MDMPSPNEHHNRLARLAGTWNGTETMHPSQWDSKGGEGTATTTWRQDLSGFVVITDYQQMRGDQVTYSGHGVYTIDPKSNEVVLHWFDVMGGQREEFRGTWDGDVLTMQSNNPHMSMRLTYDLGTAGQLTTKGEMSGDGKTWNTLFDGVHKKQ